MVDVITITILLVGFSLISYVSLWLTRKYTDNTINSVVDAFEEILSAPTMKGAMSILGKKSGEVRGQTAMVDKIAGDVMSGPKFAAIKMGASALGLDIDNYVEEHGAMQTLQAMQSVAGMLGIDVNTLLAGGGQVQQGSVGGKNPYI